MAITFPPSCNTRAEKSDHLVRVKEILRLMQNKMAKWVHDGLTVEEYNTLPSKIKAKYSYKSKLSVEEKRQFEYEDFRKMDVNLSNEMSVLRKQSRLDDTNDEYIDLDELL